MLYKFDNIIEGGHGVGEREVRVGDGVGGVRRVGDGQDRDSKYHKDINLCAGNRQFTGDVIS